MSPVIVAVSPRTRASPRTSEVSSTEALNNGKGWEWYADRQNNDILSELEKQDGNDIEDLVDINIVFKVFVEVVIVCNCVQMGLCTNPEDSQFLSEMCSLTDNVFTSVYLLEFLVKVIVFRRKYFTVSWNRFDFALLLVTIFDVWVMEGLRHIDTGLSNVLVLKAVRLIRVLRILRVLEAKMELRMVLEGLVASLRSMIWVALMLGLLIYVTSIICVSFFRDVETTAKLDFTSIPRAMFTLFTLAIVADWTDIVVPVLNKFWWSSFLFVGFSVLATFGILNLIIGVITERTAVVQDAYRTRALLINDSKRMQYIKEIANIIFTDPEIIANTQDNDEDGPTISKEQMKGFTECTKHGARIQELISGVSLPVGYKVTDCHAMFDRDATGTITRKEFVEGMGRLIFSNEFQRSCMVQSSIADVMVEMKAVETRIFFELDMLRKEASFGAYPAGLPPQQPPQPPPQLSEETQTPRSPTAPQQLPRPCLDDYKDLPSCKMLVDRLREPLAQFLAESLVKVLSDKAHVSICPNVEMVSICPDVEMHSPLPVRRICPDVEMQSPLPVRRSVTAEVFARIYDSQHVAVGGGASFNREAASDAAVGQQDLQILETGRSSAAASERSLQALIEQVHQLWDSRGSSKETCDHCDYWQDMETHRSQI